MNKNLGRLQKVDLREVWLSESTQFTPRLGEPGIPHPRGAPERCCQSYCGAIACVGCRKLNFHEH
jgi:hypothetical protein